MFEFVSVMAKVDEQPCDCVPSQCSYSKFFGLLKNFFEQKVTANEKNKFSVDYCIKHREVLEPLKDVL